MSDRFSSSPAPDFPAGLPASLAPDAVDRLDDAAWAAAVERALGAEGSPVDAAPADPAHAALARDLATLTHAIRPTVSADPAEPWARLRASLETPSAAAPAVRRSVRMAETTRKTTPSHTSRWLALGALAMACIAGVSYWTRTAEQGSTVASREYVTSAGQRAALTLPDGSRVMLAPDTRLVYNEDAHGVRTIALRGAAHFTVTHDPRRAFVVQSGAVSTRVLGTAFAVRHYVSDSAVEVAVDEGKVESHGRGLGITLVAGEVGRVTDSTSALQRGAVAADATAWTRGQLVFRDVAVPKVLATIGQWQDREFRLADSALVRQHVSVSIQIDRPEETMQVLQELLGVSATIDGRVVTLTPRRAATRARTPRALEREFPLSMEVGK